jgi:hypothetical protein
MKYIFNWFVFSTCLLIVVVGISQLGCAHKPTNNKDVVKWNGGTYVKLFDAVKSNQGDWGAWQFETNSDGSVYVRLIKTSSAKTDRAELWAKSGDTNYYYTPSLDWELHSNNIGFVKLLR